MFSTYFRFYSFFCYIYLLYIFCFASFFCFATIFCFASFFVLLHFLFWYIFWFATFFVLLHFLYSYIFWFSRFTRFDSFNRFFSRFNFYFDILSFQFCVSIVTMELSFFFEIAFQSWIFLFDGQRRVLHLVIIYCLSFLSSVFHSCPIH